MMPADVIASGYGTSADLYRLQSFAPHSVIISVTRKCPLSCGHCITSSSPKAPGPILSAATAARWARDLPEMAGRGLRNLTLTGGEPILAIDAVSVLVRAAEEAGINSYVVTSGVWATSLPAARAIVARVGPVTRWDIGSDGWHAAEMPVERIGHALDAITEGGGNAIVRLCSGDAEAEAKIVSLVAGRAPMMRQSVRAIGRGASLRSPAPETAGLLPRRPCVSTGLFVRADGSTGPCCSGLSYEGRRESPFDYGTVEAEGDLMSAWLAWRADPLLRMMRLATLASLEGWLPDAIAHTAAFSADPCEACVALWPALGRELAAGLAARAGLPAIQDKLDHLEAVLND